MITLPLIMNFPKCFYWLLFYSLDFMPLKLTTTVVACAEKPLSVKRDDYLSVSRWQCVEW